MTFTKEEIEEFLNELKKEVKKNNVGIDYKKEKNNKFIAYYKLSTSKINSMLLELEVEDFNKKEPDRNYPDRMCYMFSREYLMSFYGVKEKKIVYIKISKGKKHFLISFHEAEHKMSRPFDNRKGE